MIAFQISAFQNNSFQTSAPLSGSYGGRSGVSSGGGSRIKLYVPKPDDPFRKVRRPAIAPFKFLPVARRKEVKEEDPPMPETLQNKKLGSILEWRVALALMYFDVGFFYQFPIAKQGIAGSTTLDFLVYTEPLFTPIYINGTYWHRNAVDYTDKLKIQAVARALQGRAKTAIILWEADLQTVAMAKEVVKREVL